MIKKEFPEKWCIQWKNRETYDIIMSYFGKGWMYEDDDTHSTAWLNSDENYENPKNGKKPERWEDYTEIDIEEFKRHVLKLPVDSQILDENIEDIEDMSYLVSFIQKLD